jgi:predicted transposase YdaD
VPPLPDSKFLDYVKYFYRSIKQEGKEKMRIQNRQFPEQETQMALG